MSNILRCRLPLTREEEDADVRERLKLRRAEEGAKVARHECRRREQARGEEVVVEHHPEPGVKVKVKVKVTVKVNVKANVKVAG